MQCPKCGVANEDDAKFCKGCGQKLPDSRNLRPDEHIKIGELIYAAYKHKEAGRVEEAILACQGALALNDESASAHALLGSLYEIRGNIAAAIREYERVVELNPGSSADRMKLEDLRNGRIALLPRRQTQQEDLLEKFRPYVKYFTAGVVFLIVLSLVPIIMRRAPLAETRTGQVDQPSGIPAQGNIPQMTGPVQPPYSQPQYPEVPIPSGQQADAARNQDRPPAIQPSGTPPVPAQPDSSGNSKPTAPIIPATNVPAHGSSLPGESRANGQARSAQPVGQKEPPAIVPIIEEEIPPAPAPRVSTPTPQPAPRPSAPSTPTVDPEDRALRLQREGRYQDAISAYREALNQTSDTGRIYQQIALCYQRLGQQAIAIDQYNRAIRSYREQLAAGRDPGEVQRNIKACEAGIQVSRSQSR